MPSRRATVVVTIALAAVLVAAVWRGRGPDPLPANAAGFSAVSARDALRSVLAGDSPHPMGSAAHDSVRDRIAARLRDLGYLVQIQQAFACDGYNTCGDVANIIARRPGDPARPGIVVAAHYDSVPAGPGASDDGLGVATILEIARLIRQEPFRNPPILLIDDGEEAGLLGAEAFVADEGLRKSTGAVINVEARGTNGPSSLFETSRNNRWLVSHAIAAQPRPLTTSLFATIYDALPNDTDLTVFKRVGLQGVNFGVIGNVAAYHTPLDNLAHVDLRSLQHHGVNSLAILRKLGNTDLQTSTENAVWFDVLSLFVVRWRQRATIWIAIASMIALLVAIMLLRREQRATAAGVGAGALAFLVSIVATAAVAFVVSWLSRIRADGATWVAHPLPAIVAMWITGVVVVAAIFAAFGRRVGGEALQAGCAFAWNAIAIALAVAVPGVSFLFIVPAVALSAWSLARAFGIAFGGDIAIPALVAAVLYFPPAIFLHDALGAPSLLLIAVMIALVTSTFAAAVEPLSARIAAPSALAIVICIAISLVLQPYDADNPRRINVHYVVDKQSARWVVNRATPPLQVTAPFRTDGNIYPWLRSPMQSAPASDGALALVQIAGIRKDLFIRWTIHSSRDAQRVAIFFTGDPTSIQINGVTPPALTRGSMRNAPGWHRVVVRGSNAVIEVKMATGKPVTYVAADYTYAAPPSAAPLLAARNASTAVPSDDGDMTITLQRGKI